jgi:hypothetical protein
MSDFDLDVNNYSTNELKKFFKINDNDNSRNKIDEKMNIISEKLLFTDDSNYDSETKKKLYRFLEKAKKKMYIDFAENSDDNNFDMTIMKNYYNPKVNPNFSRPSSLAAGSPHFPLNIQNISGEYVNPINIQYKTQLLVFNTSICDNFLDSNKPTTIANNGSYTFTLPKQLKNVVQCKLAALQYPNVQYTISSIRGNNLIEIVEPSTNLSYTIEVPTGTYDYTQFPSILEYQINMAFDGSYNTVNPQPNSGYTPPYPVPPPQPKFGSPNRYQVSISPYTYKTTITNLLGIPFILVFDKPTWDSNSTTNICQRTTANIEPELYYEKNFLRIQTLGYTCGFRNIIYVGDKYGKPTSSYTSESVYDNQLIDYLYFSMKDYQLNRTDHVTGVFPGYFLDNDILALIPITSQPFTSILDSGANFIYKTRNYYGPVNISKIDVQLYGPLGNPIALFGSQFAFSLEFKLQYENPVGLSQPQASNNQLSSDPSLPSNQSFSQQTAPTSEPYPAYPIANQVVGQVVSQVASQIASRTS